MTSRALLLACALAAGWAGCADVERGPALVSDADGGGGDAQADGAALTFAAPVHGLLLTGCKDCHSAGQEAGDTQLLLNGDVAADLASVTPLVDVSAPAQSRLLTKMAGQGHGGGAVYAADSSAHRTISTWIQQGARP